MGGYLTLASLVVLTSFGPWGLPQMVQKFYSIKSEADIRRTMIVASLFAVVISFGAYYTGALTHLFYSGDVRATLAVKYGVPAGKDTMDLLMPDFLMVLSWGALAGSFLAPYCYGLFWRRTTKAGAIAGMLTGLLTMIVVVEIYRAPGGPAIPIAGALAMIVPVIVAPMVSLCTRPPAETVLARAYGGTGEVSGEKAHDLG